MPTPKDRAEVEAALRRQGVLTEGLVQWLTSIDMMVADLSSRLSEAERRIRRMERWGPGR